MAPTRTTCAHRESLGFSQEDCRRALKNAHLDLPDDPEIDFRTVLLAADAVRLRTSGRVSSRAFLLTRHSALNGRAPIEVIAEPNGPEQIRMVVDSVAAEFK